MGQESLDVRDNDVDNDVVLYYVDVFLHKLDVLWFS